MPRSLKKGPFVDESVSRKVKKALSGGSSGALKVWSRRSMIVPDFVGLTFLVHNGKKFWPVHVHENMVGHKLGEFAPTRTFHNHPGLKKADKGR